MPINSTPIDLPFANYKLTEGQAWIEVGGYAIYINKTFEGVVVDVYKNGWEDAETLASCYAFDSDLEEWSL